MIVSLLMNFKNIFRLKRIVIKIVFLLKIDLFVNSIRNIISQVEIKRIENKLNSKLNFVMQGKEGLVITSMSGDISKFKIDSTSHLKSNTYIDCGGGVTIGKYFHTGRGLTIFSTNHNYDSETHIPYDDKEIIKPVRINDFVWCGANVTITPGVTIGEGVIIGSGTVVTRNIPDYAIIGGNPAKIIKFRDIDKFKLIKKSGNFY